LHKGDLALKKLSLKYWWNFH